MNIERVFLFWASLIVFSLLLTVIIAPTHLLSVTTFGIITDMRWFGYSLFGRDPFSVLRLIFVALVLVILTKAWKGH